MTLDEVRSFSLSLPGATEEPHFERTSFRVNGKIFATALTDGASVNIFVGEESILATVAEFPGICDLLYWGKRLVGVTVRLDRAQPQAVHELLEEAWSLRSPKATVRQRDVEREQDFR